MSERESSRNWRERQKQQFTIYLSFESFLKFWFKLRVYFVK